MRIEFTDQELDLVSEVMQLHQETLLRDIARTDHRDCRRMLRGRLDGREHSREIEGCAGSVNTE